MARPSPSLLLEISTDRLELGMYVHALHCSWLNAPFWRKSFLLTEPDDLIRVREAASRVTIDTSRGRGLTLIPVRQAPIDAEEHHPAPLPAVTRSRRKVSLSGTDRARAVAERSKAAVIAFFEQSRLGDTIHLDDVVPVVDEIASATFDDATAMITVTRLKTRDEYTFLHSVAVCALMVHLAGKLGFDAEAQRVMGMAGLLHDIGKTTIPRAIIDKPGLLDPEELRTMRTHPAAGHDILRGMPDLTAVVLDVCLHHHEKMDGTGYPEGLSGDQLSTAARMAAICDVYDALTSIRAYKRPWSPQEALGRMLGWDGHFDPAMLQAFIASLGIVPLGALVRLHSNHLGVVIAEGDDPATPIVRTFFEVAEQRLLPARDVDTASDRIIRTERGEYWFQEGWPQLLRELVTDTRAAFVAPPAPVAGARAA